MKISIVRNLIKKILFTFIFWRAKFYIIDLYSSMKRLADRDSQLVNATETVSTIAHCLRELIENSLDAQSTIINVRMTGNGLDSIVVTDNGCGISKEGLQILCTEGATSKKFGGEMSGGRGKALDAISKLAIVTVESCCDNSQQGYRLSFNENDERIIQPISRAKGTCFTVQSLFYSYPVRRRYCIEKKQQQIQEIQELCAAFAIATNASFTVLLDNKNIVQVSNFNRQNRIKSVLGPNIAKGLITGKAALDGWREGAFVEYFTTSPTTLSNGRIIITVNNRPVVNFPIIRALKQEFKLCAGPKIPTIVLFITAQREYYDFFPDSPLIGVSFSREEVLQQKLCSILGEAWKSTSQTLSLTKDNPSGSGISMSDITPISSPVPSPTRIKPTLSTNSNVVNSVRVSKRNIYEIKQRRNLASNYKQNFGPSNNVIETESFDNMEIIGQWNKSFLITRLGSDVYAIDQHAACEAQNFEKLRKVKSKKKQKLLEPVLLKVTPEDIENAISHREKCSQFGFEYDVCDDGIKVTTIPSDQNVVNGIEDLQELLGMIHDVPQSNTPMTRMARIQLAFHACHSSVRVGDVMNNQQIKKLLTRMAHSDYPWNCPHGRPTWCCIHILDSEDNDDSQPNSDIIPSFSSPKTEIYA
ncbi:mismatch repair protein [Tritrichomonas foetus]|uniref:Mismatch repair protein n=1 Tax=Tritrichomonas foetus TaxID=1144522 RepID=A0A1J4JA65_9EUKA|nr:mismatch repair protein [Tritrichomonas foetus]|eukprot:OHS95119.1 mismatch repair protein [Tritrichomonas foetus]